MTAVPSMNNTLRTNDAISALKTNIDKLILWVKSTELFNL